MIAPPDFAHPVRELARPAGTLRYVDVGEGPDLVCVHGNPTWGYHYRNVIAATAGDHRVVVPDHLGMGRSDTPDPSRYAYDMAARLSDLSALLDHLDVGRERPATLMAHDWGGAIGVAWAVRNPDRVGRLVLLNTAAFPLPPDMPVPWPLRPAMTPVVGEALVQRLNLFVDATLAVGVRRRRLPPPVRRAYRAPYGSWHDRTAVLRFVRDIPTRPQGPTHALLAETATGLARLADRPAMLVWGRRDPVLTPRVLGEWRRLLPEAEVHVIDDAGHLVLEDAAEAVPMIVDFLARTRDAVAAPPV